MSGFDQKEVLMGFAVGRVAWLCVLSKFNGFTAASHNLMLLYFSLFLPCRFAPVLPIALSIVKCSVTFDAEPRSNDSKLLTECPFTVWCLGVRTRLVSVTFLVFLDRLGCRLDWPQFEYWSKEIVSCRDTSRPGPGGPPSLHFNRHHYYFPGIKRPELDVDH